MLVKIELPTPPEGYTYLPKVCFPKKGDYYLNTLGKLCLATFDFAADKYICCRNTWVPVANVKGIFYWLDGTWYFTCGNVGRLRGGWTTVTGTHVRATCFLDFCAPDVPGAYTVDNGKLVSVDNGEVTKL